MTTAHLFVDQVEGDLAVLIDEVEDTKEFPIPLQDLPEGTKEGDWLTAEIPNHHTVSSFFTAVQDGDEKMPTFVLDRTTGEAIKKRVQSLMDELSS